MAIVGILPTMAYVTPRRNGTWELRESVATPKGPRSRTLASFRTLSDEVIEHARTRANAPIDAEETRRAARRAGAPVALGAADRAAAELLRELDAGRGPHPILRQLLVDALQAKRPTRLDEAPRQAAQNGGADTDRAAPGSLDNARASASWLAATPHQRGEALQDLLLLGESLQHGRPDRHERFPRLDRAA